MKQAVIEARRKPEPVAEVKEETIPVEEVKPSVVKMNIKKGRMAKWKESFGKCILRILNKSGI